MKGIVFTEFVDFMERSYGLETTDRVLSGSRLASRGAYTTVATYDPREMTAMVRSLAAATASSPGAVLRAFGRELFGRLAALHPELIEGFDSTFALLSGLEARIHREVQKLHPDAELPSFECDGSRDDRVVLTYRPSRGLADLAAGMIEGCTAHFREQLEVLEEDLSGGSRTHVRLTVIAR